MSEETVTPETAAPETPAPDQTAAQTDTAPPADTPATAATDEPWHSTLTMDDDLKAIFDARGYDKSESMEDAFRKSLQSAKSAESKLRAPAERVLVIPEDGATPEFWKQNADRLGIPETAEGYDFERPSLPEGMVYDTALEKRMLDRLHAAGAPKHVAAAAVEEYAAVMSELANADATALQSANDTTMEALKADWGQNFDSKVDLGKRALAQFAQKAGFDEETTKATVARMAQDAGDANIIKLFASIGASMDEDTITLGDTPGIGGSLTAEEARAEYDAATRTEDYKKAKAAGGRAWQQMNAKTMAILDRAKME